MYLHHHSIPSKHSTPSVTIPLEAEQKIISRTDREGKILFYNKNFAKISGYTKEELLGASHNILRHPDMPRAVFYLLWQQLLAGIPTRAVIKNVTKSGEHYWVTLDFNPLYDSNRSIISFLAEGEQSSSLVIQEIEPLYTRILLDEKRHGMHHSIKSLSDHLVAQGIASYNDYIHKITQKKRKGILASLGLSLRE